MSLKKEKENIDYVNKFIILGVLWIVLFWIIYYFK